MAGGTLGKLIPAPGAQTLPWSAASGLAARAPVLAKRFLPFSEVRLNVY